MRMRMQHALRMQMCTCACQAKLERLRRLQPSRQEGAKATKAKRSARRRKLPATQPEAPPPPVDAQAQLKALPDPWAGLPTQGVLEFVYAHVQRSSAPAGGAATAGGGAATAGGGAATAGGCASVPSRPAPRALKRPPTAAVAAPVTPLMGDDLLEQVLGQLRGSCFQKERLRLLGCAMHNLRAAEAEADRSGQR